MATYGTLHEMRHLVPLIGWFHQLNSTEGAGLPNRALLNTHYLAQGYARVLIVLLEPTNSALYASAHEIGTVSHDQRGLPFTALSNKNYHWTLVQYRSWI